MGYLNLGKKSINLVATNLSLSQMEAMMRERSERIRKSEEEREMRRKRLESIMSRVNRSDRSLSRGIPNSGSANSLTGSVTGVSSSNGIDEDSVKSGATVHFSLAPNNVSNIVLSLFHQQKELVSVCIINRIVDKDV